MDDKASKLNFRPKARVLQHLGDQLIGTPRLAVFELVKNAYDADATKVSVEIAGIGTKHPSIRVTDDGSGMSLDTVTNIWLVIAHDHKAKQLESKRRTDRGRLPVGSKGLGRLSVHKLGNLIRMVSRQPAGIFRSDFAPFEHPRRPFCQSATLFLLLGRAC